MKNLLALAISIAAQGFEDKTDKAGEPYILHCIRVMQQGTTVEEKILGILHDTIEDEVTTIAHLRELGFPESILDDLKLLTHGSDEDYETYIKRVASSPTATRVKLADLKDNSDITRLKGLTKKDFDRMEKYHKAYTYLSKL